MAATPGGLRPAAVPARPARRAPGDGRGACPGGVVDCSIGTPVDPMPEVARAAGRRGGGAATGYPPSIGSARRTATAAAAWIDRRFGVARRRPTQVVACIGTKELVGVAAAARCRCATRRATPCSTRRSRTRPTRWARRSPGCARCRSRSTTDWHLDLDAVDADDADARAGPLAQRPREPDRRGGDRAGDGAPPWRGRATRGDRSSRATSATPSSPTTTRATRRTRHRARRGLRRRARGALAVEALEHGRAAGRVRRRRPRARRTTSARCASTPGS